MKNIPDQVQITFISNRKPSPHLYLNLKLQNSGPVYLGKWPPIIKGLHTKLVTSESRVRTLREQRCVAWTYPIADVSGLVLKLHHRSIIRCQNKGLVHFHLKPTTTSGTYTNPKAKLNDAVAHKRKLTCQWSIRPSLTNTTDTSNTILTRQGRAVTSTKRILFNYAFTAFKCNQLHHSKLNPLPLISRNGCPSRRAQSHGRG